MKTITCLLFTLSLFATGKVHAQAGLTDAVPSAITVLNKATTQAAAENKKILLMFHASWCGWCHKMDSSLNDISCKKFFDDNFVITHITIDESAEKKKLENAGGWEMIIKYNGKEQGLPYWVILDKDQKLLFDSQIRTTRADGKITGASVGCPASQKEVDYFISVLRQATSLQQNQLDLIAKRFRENENKPLK